MSFYQDFKSFYQSNILLFIILLFVIVYFVINWSNVSNSNYFNGDYTKTILITGIVFLIFHMLITWDDNITNTDDEIIVISKYKFDTLPNPITLPNPNELELQPIQPLQPLNNKYKIVKNYNINQKPNLNFSNNYSNDDSKLSNRNIFISHKNSSKYGLKF